MKRILIVTILECFLLSSLIIQNNTLNIVLSENTKKSESDFTSKSSGDKSNQEKNTEKTKKNTTTRPSEEKTENIQSKKRISDSQEQESSKTSNKTSQVQPKSEEIQEDRRQQEEDTPSPEYNQENSRNNSDNNEGYYSDNQYSNETNSNDKNFVRSRDKSSGDIDKLISTINSRIKQDMSNKKEDDILLDDKSDSSAGMKYLVIGVLSIIFALSGFAFLIYYNFLRKPHKSNKKTRRKNRARSPRYLE